MDTSVNFIGLAVFAFKKCMRLACGFIGNPADVACISLLMDAELKKQQRNSFFNATDFSIFFVGNFNVLVFK